MRKAIGAMGGLLMIVALMAQPSMAAAPAVPDPGNVALAERFSDMSRLALGGRDITSAHFRVAAALLEAANKLDPSNPRYPRLWADAMLQVGDANRAVEALKKYVNLVPDDKQALVQLADLHARAYETVDQRLAYLNGWVDDNRLPAEVRSHLAYMAYSAYEERGQESQAKNALDKSLKLNPLNLDALKARFASEAAGTAYERITTLLAMLKSNPGQVTTLGYLSQDLADLGLAAQSLQYYLSAIGLMQMEHVAIPPQFLRDYATELSIVSAEDVPNGRTTAKQVIDQLVTANPSDYQALCLQLLLERLLDQKDAEAKSVQQAMNVLSNRLQTIRQAMGDKSATTRPVTSPDPIVWGSLEDDAKKIKVLKGDTALDPQQIRRDYVDTLAEISWFEIYFLAKPADAKPLIDALKHLLPENDATVARLQGWSFLMQGDLPAAKVKLSAVADKEPLAALGMAKMAGPNAQKEGQRLLTQHPSGILAVQILEAMRDQKVELKPEPQRVTAVLEALRQFPANWMNILVQPQTFYVVTGEPLKVRHTYAEPIYGRVSIQNISDYPITIGVDGVIKPEILFDAQVRGVMAAGLQQQLNGAAVDRLGHELVLQPRQTVTQVCRLDQGPVGQLLDGSPAPSLEVTYGVRINPSSFGIGPAGQSVNFAQIVDRAGFPLTNDSMATLNTQLQQGGPAEKIRCLDLAYSLGSIFAQQQQQQQGNDDIKKTLMQIIELVKTATHDSSEPVQAWADNIMTRFSAPAERSQIIGRMINDPYWAMRLLGLASMTTLPPEDQRGFLRQVISRETEPVIVSFAKNLNEIFEQTAGAATRPSTAPATIPSQVAPTQPSSAPAVVLPKTPLDIGSDTDTTKPAK